MPSLAAQSLKVARQDLRDMASGAVKLGKLRDFVLVAVAGLYAIGYVFWSWHAHRNNLGQLPALEAQYLVGGLLPAAAIALLLYLLIWVLRLQRHLSRRQKSSRAKLLSEVAFGVTNAVWLLVYVAVEELEWVDWPRWTMYLAQVPLVLTALFVPPRGDQTRSPWWQRGMAIYLFVVVVGAGVYLYATDVYPQIPQAFGGVEPRCAELTLRDGGSWGALSSAGQATNGTVQSRPVWVYFDGKDLLLVKPQRPGDLSDDPTFEIQRSDVRDIVWCG